MSKGAAGSPAVAVLRDVIGVIGGKRKREVGRVSARARRGSRSRPRRLGAPEVKLLCFSVVSVVGPLLSFCVCVVGFGLGVFPLAPGAVAVNVNPPTTAARRRSVVLTRARGGGEGRRAHRLAVVHGR